METLSERQRLLLSLIIHEHTRTAQPVPSQALVDRFSLDMSSATVRNELSELTEMGFVRQPHTSAGRIPTEDGYRYFVSRLIQDTSVPENTRSMISHQFYQMRSDVDQWMHLAASVLAQHSKGASLVTAPHPTRARLKHVELISTRGRQVLMVLVMQGGEVHQQLLTLTDPLSQENLSSIALSLTSRLRDKDAEGVRTESALLSGQELEIAGWIADEMDHSNALVGGEVFLDGLSNVLAEPEFSGNEDARRALQVLEERPMLEDLLSRTIPHDSLGGVQVLIGGEGTRDELRQCSIVLARYGSPGISTGMLGVLGPLRMSYGRSISIVRFISGLLSDLVTNNLVDDGSQILN